MSDCRRSKRSSAYVLMCSLAGKFDRRNDPVTQADLRTSMQDARVALSLAIDGGPEGIDRNGYRVPH